MQREILKSQFEPWYSEILCVAFRTQCILIDPRENCLQLSPDPTQRQIEILCVPSYMGLRTQLKLRRHQLALEFFYILSEERVAKLKQQNIW